jgi:hypothetical protein
LYYHHSGHHPQQFTASPGPPPKPPTPGHHQPQFTAPPGPPPKPPTPMVVPQGNKKRQSPATPGIPIAVTQQGSPMPGGVGGEEIPNEARGSNTAETPHQDTMKALADMQGNPPPSDSKLQAQEGKRSKPNTTPNGPPQDMDETPKRGSSSMEASRRQLAYSPTQDQIHVGPQASDPPASAKSDAPTTRPPTKRPPTTRARSARTQNHQFHPGSTEPQGAHLR